jgi:signal transduction histidine kinase
MPLRQSEERRARSEGPNGNPQPSFLAPRSSLPEIELSPGLRRELLHPEAWREGLEKYALAMHLGVALVDADGHQIGPCLNPQPLWNLLRSRIPPGVPALGTRHQGGVECPFAIEPLSPCACISDALRKGTVVRARDRTGLVHFAVPLLLGQQKIGVLIAGQVFDRYPEQLPLEQTARRLGLSAAQVWQTARLEHPISPSHLQVYQDLLKTLGQTFLQGRYHALLEASRLAELHSAQDALRQANEELERRVAERTAALEEVQKKALQAERLAAIGEAAAGLAHESRNALQRSQACLAMLEVRIRDRPEALDLLTRLQSAQDDLHRMLEQVRAYASPIRLDLDVCDLAEVWREAWADLASLRQNREAELREEVDTLDLRCVASPFHLKQVFYNLFDNALAAAGDPVRVVVRCSPAEIEGKPAIRVAVRDNGPGFTEEQRRRVFGPFYTTKVRGTGLGLAICKRIVEAHGGRITVGEDPAPGAEVVVTMPWREPE